MGYQRPSYAPEHDGSIVHAHFRHLGIKQDPAVSVLSSVMILHFSKRFVTSKENMKARLVDHVSHPDREIAGPDGTTSARSSCRIKYSL